MQSYLRQEAEAISLKAKYYTAISLKDCGVKPINLQHDGLVIACGKISSHSMRELLEKHSSLSLCYTQPVEIKPMNPPVPDSISQHTLTPIPYHFAVKTPLFFDPFTNGPPLRNRIARLTKERRALEYAKLGLTHFCHITIHNKIMNEKQFYHKYPSLRKTGSYKDILSQAPLPVIKSITAGPDYSTLGWVICKNNILMLVKKFHIPTL